MNNKLKTLKFSFTVMVIILLGLSCCKETVDTVDKRPTVADIDGNIYHYITIGSQVWMVENLSTTRYNNGDTILEVMGSKQWTNLTISACSYYYDYDYIISRKHDIYQTIETYGRLYNWYAVTDSRKIAPEGWHVATSDDWITLINYAGGKDVAAGKLKETGTKHWDREDPNSTNEFGFTALPGGICDLWGAFHDITTHGYWWTVSSADEKLAFSYQIYCFMDGWEWNRSLKSGILGPLSYQKNNGLSVRCVKD
jgi:uncharacterized protein (TIGR02145 family)